MRPARRIERTDCARSTRPTACDESVRRDPNSRRAARGTTNLLCLEHDPRTGSLESDQNRVLSRRLQLIRVLATFAECGDRIVRPRTTLVARENKRNAPV